MRSRPVFKKKKKKLCTFGCRTPKQCFIILLHVISMNGNIGKKITGLEIMAIESQKNEECFQTCRTDV